MKTDFHDVVKSDFHECVNWLPDCPGCSSCESCYCQLVFGVCVENPNEYEVFEGVIKLARIGVTCDTYLLAMMTKDEIKWCVAHKVLPQVEPDVYILRRAIHQKFRGKKLDKALYKVRHRDLFLASKKRNYERRKARQKALEASETVL